VGPPGVGLFHKISADGEVLMSGRNIMKNYEDDIETMYG
jgi:long-chain acyl-CoA synthetase